MVVSCGRIGAALRQKVVGKARHPVIDDGAADDPTLAGLLDETSLHEGFDMMCQGRSADTGPCPENTDGQPFGTCAHQHFEHAEALGGTKGGKGSRRLGA